jgi:exopolysaccharide production protein ExoQ
MTDIHAAANGSSAPADWIDLRADPREAHARAKARPSRIDADAAIGFVLFLIMLFIPQLDTAGAALFTLISVWYALARRRQLTAVLLPRAFLLSVPALALFSVLWSEVPLLTLKYSLEFGLTVVLGLLLSAVPNPKRLIEGIFLAFAAHVLVSIGLGQTVALGANGETAFAGLNDSKNLLADAAATGFVVSSAVFFIGIEDRKLSRCLVAPLVGIVQIYAIVAARSAGAAVGLLIAEAVFLFFLILRKTTFPIRATALGGLGFSLVFIALAYETLSDIVVDVATRYFDKDTTFTGRAYLWERAGDLINEKPLLGRGFHAFWNQGNPDAEGMWRYLSIQSESGFNFHNSFVEVLVHLGWFGLFVFCLTLLIAFVFVLTRFIRRPDLTQCFWLAMLVYQCIRMPIETIGTYEFSFTTVLVFIGFGYALTPVEQPRPRQRAAAVAAAAPAR